MDILSDACKVILGQPSSFTGQFCIDEVVLRMQGMTDFSKYRVHPDCSDADLTMDFFLPANPYSNCGPLPRQILKSKF